MIKIGMADGKTLVALTNSEFIGLAGQTTSNIPDGTDVSLAPIKAKLDLVDSKTAELVATRDACNELSAKITAIGV
jgi:hypothetical protein